MGFAVGQPLLWPAPADWGSPMSEALAFLTDVMQAGTGAQQARALRDTPRRSFAFDCLLDGDARRIVDAFRFDIGVKQFLLPIWPDVQVLAAGVALGATAIPCATTGYDFAAGAQAVLWSDINTWELVTVSAIAADSLTLTAGTAAAWPAGTLLYPVRKARLQGVPQASSQNEDLSTLKVQALIDEPCAWPAAYPTATVYRGVPVLEWRNEESDDPSDEYGRAGGTVDYDTGPVFYFDTPDMPFRAQSQRFQLWGRAAHASFRSLLYALNGRAGQLWVPSWLADMRLNAPVSDIDVQIQVPWMGYTTFGYQQANRRDLAIELNDGTLLYRRITGSADAGDHEVLQLDAALGEAVDPGAVRQIGFLSMCAQVADTVQIDHNTDADGEGVCTLNWQAVKSDV